MERTIGIAGIPLCLYTGSQLHAGFEVSPGAGETLRITVDPAVL